LTKRRRVLGASEVENFSHSQQKAWFPPGSGSGHFGVAGAKRSRSPGTRTVHQSNHDSSIIDNLKALLKKQENEMKVLKTTYVTEYKKLETVKNRLQEENKILKRAVVIQEENSKKVASEIEMGKDYIRRLEQQNSQLRYCLESQSNSYGGGGFGPTPPDVY